MKENVDGKRAFVIRFPESNCIYICNQNEKEKVRH